jgi:WD40 repeat protein
MRLKVLGGLGLEQAELTRPKPLLLLSYIVLEGSRARRDLAELFWPESQDPMQSLRVALTHINKEAKGAISANEKRVWTDLSSDAAHLQEALAKNKYKEALELYQGPFLDGFDSSEVGEELESWIYQTRERMAKEVQEAYLILGEYEASQGRFAQGAIRAEEAYFLRSAPEPDSESLQRLYLLFRAGESPHLESVAKEIKGYGLETSLSAAQAQAKARTLAINLVLPDNPYQGLLAFQEQDARFFFGREKPTGEILRLIEHAPFIVSVIGNSGAGKSSLVFAGVIPQLRTQKDWLVISLRPGRQPFASLAQSLVEVLDNQVPGRDQILESQQLAHDLQTQTFELSRILEHVLVRHPQQRLLLLVDQLEELFTINESRDPANDTPYQAKQFLELLLRAGSSLNGQLALLFTLRADFLGMFLGDHVLRDMLQQTQYFLAPMNENELHSSIVEPARKQGVNFEAGLVERIIEDVSQGNLPLLEFALTQLWEKQEKNLLTHHAYDLIGGVEEALTRHADESFNKLSSEEKLLAKKVFLQLVYPGTNQEDTRRIATREELEESWFLVQKLASYPARLLVTGYSQRGQQTAEVIHETLIRSWGTLRQWLEEYRSFRTWQERLRQDVRLWAEQDHADSTLLRGYRLSEALQKMQQNEDFLSSNEKLFIERSGLFSEQETSDKEHRRQEQLESLQKLATEEGSRRKAEEARVRIRNRALRMVSLLSLLALSFAFFFFNARNQALSARNEAVVSRTEAEEQKSVISSLLSELLAAVAVNTVEATPQRSLLLSLEAYAVAATNAGNTQEPQKVLRQVVAQTGGWVFPEQKNITASAFSPDGRWMVTGDDDARANFWDVADPTKGPILTLGTNQGVLHAVAFSPDGKWLATGGSTDTVRLWPMDQFPEQTPVATILLEHQSDVTDIDFSPDGAWMTTVSRDGYVRLWDTQTWQLYKLSEPLPDPVQAVDFSPDGVWLAAATLGDERGSVFIWPLDPGKAFKPIIYILKDAAWSLAFSMDSAHLAIGDEDGQIHLLQMQSIETQSIETVVPVILKAHSITVVDLVFSPDGNWLVSASWDKTVRLWPVSNILEKTLEGIPIIFRGHEDRLASALAFSPDSRWLISGAKDGARLWDMRLPESDLVVLPPGKFGKRTFSLSPDGTQMAIGIMDGTVELRQMADLMGSVTVLGKHDSWVESVKFSPDGKWLASGSDASNGGEHTLMLRNLEIFSLAPIYPALAKNAKTLYDVEFSPDSQFLAVASADNTAKVWRVSDLSRPLYVFSGFKKWVTDVAFSPDGQYLAAASFDHSVKIWNLKEPQSKPRVLEGHQESVRALAFSPDGKWLASGDWANQVLLWSFEDLAQPPVVLDAANLVWSLAFSWDSTYLAAGTEEGPIALWDVQSGKRVILAGHSKPTWSLAFSPDNRWLVSASEDGSQRFWPLDINQVKALACQKAGRNLQQKEWLEVFGSSPYRQTCPQFAAGQ